MNSNPLDQNKLYPSPHQGSFIDKQKFPQTCSELMKN